MEDGTLCWGCAKACTSECSWSKDLIPVEGWTAEWGEINETYNVINCPEFVPDSGERTLDKEGCEALVMGIVKLAVSDYRNASRKVKGESPEECANRARGQRRKIERFFRSRAFAHMTDVNPEALIEALRKEVSTKMTDRDKVI